MKLNKMFPRKYATGEDLQGTTPTVTIAGISVEMMRPGPQSAEVEKFVIYFKETKKGMVLSRTLGTKSHEV